MTVHLVVLAVYIYKACQQGVGPVPASREQPQCAYTGKNRCFYLGVTVCVQRRECVHALACVYLQNILNLGGFHLFVFLHFLSIYVDMTNLKKDWLTVRSHKE